MDISQAKIPTIRILGEIPNPYKLSNAQAAMEKLKSSNSRTTAPTTIRTTSRYVVFKPQTEMQADSLLTKTDLELFTYPLHLEIEGDLEEYREPSLSSPEQPDLFPNDEVQGFTIKDCENAIRGNVRNFGAFYQNLINNPKAQSQLLAFDELFSFYYSLSFNCSSGNNAPNTKQEGGVR